MRLAPIAASIIIATMAGGAFAATSNDEAAQDRTNTAAYGNTHKWYEAGDRVIQSQEERTKLDRQGFPQYD